MKRVFILQHVHQLDNDNEDVKFIGVYSSRENAEDAVDRLSLQPGFRENRGGFDIDEYEIDADHWTEGYVTLQGDEGAEET